MAVLIGIDVGTSGLKAVAFSESGAVLATAGESYPTARPQPGWAEHDPQDWWQAACRALQTLLQAVPAAEVAAVGIDGMSWSIVGIDSQGEPVCSSPIWMDTRATAQCDALIASYGEQALLQLAGNPVGAGFSLPKLLWWKQNIPEAFRRIDCVLESNAYLAYRLTGVRSIEPSQGFGWHCYDMQNNRWDQALCRSLGIFDLLPPVVQSHAVLGGVTEEAARLTGLACGTPVVAGGMDTSCGCLTAGLLQAGQAQEQGGQSGGIAVYADRYAPHPALMTVRHVLPDGYLYCGATVGGSASYAWFEQQFGHPERAAATKGNSSFKQLDQAALQTPPGAEGVVFLPYMNGERTPIWDPHAKGCYFGLDFTKTRAHMARATMEGVGFSLRHILESYAEIGLSPKTLNSVGGATQSPVWMQIKADITGCSLRAKRSDVGSALGAAMLAGVGAGVWTSFTEAFVAVDQPGACYDPNPDNAPVYDRLYPVYRNLYDRTKDLMAAL